MGKGRLGHTAVHKGRRVLVVLRSGELFIDRFIERTGRDIRLEGRGKVAKKDLRVMSLYKQQGEKTWKRQQRA